MDIKISSIFCMGLMLGSGFYALGKSKEPVQPEKKDSSKPNIIVIVADDLGFSDLGCYGGELNTPNLDQMASKGVRFTQFYNAARCCPSRACLLTGLYPHKAGIGHMTDDYGEEGYKGHLSEHAVTIAEVLKNSGYNTMMTGKWHVSDNISPDGDKSNWPLQRGFEKFFGTLPGYGSFWDPAAMYSGNTPVKAGNDFYYTEVMTDTTVNYIRDAVKADNPFFMYVAYAAPHYPLHAREKYIKKNKGKFDQGWDVLRQKRMELLKSSGMISSQTQLPERDEQSNPWDKEEYPSWQASRMEVFAAMVEQVDEGIGRIVKTVKELGQESNTLILFLSDNGGSAEGHLNGAIERWGTPWKSKLIPEYTLDGKKVKAGDFPGEPLGGAETFGSYGVKWANLSNAPFRRHKSWMHEGGISAPFIAYWPNSIEDEGALRHTPTHLVDLMATFLDVTGAKYPSYRKGLAVHQFQGKSLLPVFDSDTLANRALCWEHEGNRAIRKGKWKLVSEYPGTWATVRKYENKGRWELYDMEVDRTETKDLARKYPKLVKQLSDEWSRWAHNNFVIDWEILSKGEY